MKVAVISYKTEISGGSNRSLLSIIDVMLEQKVDVELILPKKYGKLYEEAKNRNIKCTYIPYARTGKRKSKFLLINVIKNICENLKECYNYLLTLIYSSKIKKMNVDCIYVNGSAMHAGRFINKILHITHVWHIREYYDKDFIYPTNIYKRMENNTDLIILISNDLYDEYSKYISKDKLIMISNGIKYEKTESLLKHDGINILLVGRISEQKCQLDAIKALQKLNKNYLDINKEKVKLFFAGKTVTEQDENYYKKLKEYIDLNKLQESVIFLGEVENISNLRRKMDIELMCSLREPFGRVTVEAMRSNLAVIGANSGGTKDIIVNGENGLLYEPSDIDQLTRLINLLIVDRNKRKELAKSGKKFSENHFTELQLLKTVNTIKSIVKKKEENSNEL